MGSIRIAQATGKPIIQMMYGAKRRIVFNSWDRFSLPMPFTKVVLLHGEPVLAPPDADDEQCERIRLQIELEMNRMAFRCDRWFGGEPVGLPGHDLPANNAKLSD